MASLTAQGQATAHRLLAWDRGRISLRKMQGFDVSAYEERQQRADAAIVADVSTWTTEVRDLYMTVLEATRSPLSPVTRELNVGGVAPYPVPALNRADRDAWRALAREIGVISRLAEASPLKWSDVDTEGD